MSFQTALRIIKLPAFLSIVSIASAALLMTPTVYNTHNFYNILSNTALILFSSAGISLIYNCIVAILSRYEHHSPMIFDVVRRGLKVIACLLLFHIIISIVDVPKYEEILHKFTTIIMIAAITWFCLQLFSVLEKISFNRCQQRNGNLRSNYTRIHLLKNIASVFTVIIAISLCCMLFKNISSIGVSILASAGLMTAVIGFAAQQTISSIFNGIQFAFINPFQIGDVIKIQDDIGIIEEISITHVNLRISESKILHYPINYFFQNNFLILSSFSHGIEFDIKISVDKSDKIENIAKIIKSTLDQSNYWNKKVFTLTISNMDMNTTTLTVNVSVDQFSDIANLKYEMYKNIDLSIRKAKNQLEKQL